MLGPAWDPAPTALHLWVYPWTLTSQANLQTYGSAWLWLGPTEVSSAIYFVLGFGFVCIYGGFAFFFLPIFPIFFFLFTYLFIHILNKIEVYCFHLVSSSDEQILTGQNNLSPIKLFEMSVLSIGNWLTKMRLKILLKTVKSTLIKLTTNFI